MSLIKKLGTNLFTALIVLIISVILFAATSFLLNSDYKSVPLGFLISGGLVSLTYVLTYFFNKIDEKNDTNYFSIVAIAVKFTIDAASIVMLGIMYYYWDIKLFNIFTYVGVYTFGTICFALSHIIVSRKEKKDE